MLANRLSISSWSLHRCLGPLRWTVWDETARTQAIRLQEQPSLLELTELPAAANAHGLAYLELCHFHFPSLDEAYLKELRQAFAEARVVFHTLLVDYGDIASPDPYRRESDLKYLAEWIDAASRAGASAVRIVAGEQPGSDAAAVARSVQALRELRRHARGKGIEVVTENFRELTAHSVQAWSEVMDGVGSGFRTVVDFGNLSADEQLSGVRYGAPLAHSFHAKPPYSEGGELLAEPFLAQLSIAEQLGGETPVSIIFDRDGDMWEGIERIKNVMLQSR